MDDELREILKHAIAAIDLDVPTADEDIARYESLIRRWAVGCVGEDEHWDKSQPAPSLNKQVKIITRNELRAEIRSRLQGEEHG